MDDTRERLRRFIEERCVIHRPEGIRLASGRIATWYLDCRIAVLDPESLPLIADLVYTRMMALPDKPSALGGAIVGAVPITAAVVALSAKAGSPVSGFMVRREVKSHGTQRKIENAPVPGTMVAIVEDVVTSGGSTVQAIDAAEEAGLKVVGIFPIVDREEGGGDTLRKRCPGASYQPLFLKSDLSNL